MDPNKPQQESTTNSQPWTPPVGIWYEFNKQRPTAPFVLRWKESGTPKSKSYPTEADRETHARKLASNREEYGKEILSFDPKKWRRFLVLEERAGGIEVLSQALDEWKGAGGTKREVVAVQDAVKQYITFRSGQGLSDDTMRHLRKHVQDRFGGFYAGEKVVNITPAKITRWLDSLLSSKGANEGQPVEAVTRRHHRKDLNTFLDYCISQGWITRNPCELVPVPKVEEDDVELMTVAEGRALFEANEDQPVIGRIALEAFGFCRASRAGTIAREHLNIEERGILFRGAGRKGSKARYRQGHPDCLWAWVARAPDDTWRMKWWQYRNEKRAAFARAGLKGGSENKLRKTCLSAHLAWLKNQPLTSYLAQHRHTSTTDIYLGCMGERDGAAWFQIGPRFC